MFCPKCGNELSEGSKCCTRCGASIHKGKGGNIELGRFIINVFVLATFVIMSFTVKVVDVFRIYYHEKFTEHTLFQAEDPIVIWLFGMTCISMGLLAFLSIKNNVKNKNKLVLCSAVSSIICMLAMLSKAYVDIENKYGSGVVVEQREGVVFIFIALSVLLFLSNIVTLDKKNVEDE